MKKLILIPAFIAVLIISVTLFKLSDSKSYATVGKTVVKSDEDVTNTPIYIVKTYDGRVAVFRYGEAVPSKITDINPELLSEEDRKLLSKGIEIHSQKEFIQLMEDYDY